MNFLTKPAQCSDFASPVVVPGSYRCFYAYWNCHVHSCLVDQDIERLDRPWRKYYAVRNIRDGGEGPRFRMRAVNWKALMTGVAGHKVRYWGVRYGCTSASLSVGGTQPLSLMILHFREVVKSFHTVDFHDFFVRAWHCLRHRISWPITLTLTIRAIWVPQR